MTTPFQHTLHERLHGWFDLFRQRPDVEFVRDYKTVPADAALSLGAPSALSEDFPLDVRGFAEKTNRFAFQYRVPDTEVEGFLFLSLGVYQVDHYLLVDGEQVDTSKLYALENDELGTGLSGYLVIGEAPYVVWDIETCAKFASLSDYLTAGAKQAFSYNPCWQKGRDSQLAARSWPRDTPAPELRAALIERGAAPSMADDLLAWLGGDVALLLAR